MFEGILGVIAIFICAPFAAVYWGAVAVVNRIRGKS